MPTTLEEITGGPPKAPRPPDVEDVLGPPPHAPRIGGRGGGGLHLAGRLRSPAPPPRLARPRPQTPAPAAEPAPRVIVQPARPNPVTPNQAPQPPAYNPREGMQRQRLARAQAQAQRRQAAAAARNLQRRVQRNQQQPQPQPQQPPPHAPEDEGMPPEVRARRAQQWQQIQAQMQQLRRAPRGMGVKPPRARRQAQATKARKDAEDWRTRAGQLPIEGEGMSPEVKAKRAQQYAEMKGTLDALRKPAEPSSGEATP